MALIAVSAGECSPVFPAEASGDVQQGRRVTESTGFQTRSFRLANGRRNQILEASGFGHWSATSARREGRVDASLYIDLNWPRQRSPIVARSSRHEPIDPASPL